MLVGEKKNNLCVQLLKSDLIIVMLCILWKPLAFEFENNIFDNMISLDGTKICNTKVYVING